MEQDELQKLLDSLMQGPLGTRKQHHWDHSINQKGLPQPQFHTEKALAKKKANPSHATKQWRESRSKYLTGRKQPQHSKRMKGKGNPKYGTGNLYIEVTTGFKGYATDMFEKFGISILNLAAYAEKDRPMKRGVAKGKHFKKLAN